MGCDREVIEAARDLVNPHGVHAHLALQIQAAPYDAQIVFFSPVTANESSAHQGQERTQVRKHEYVQQLTLVQAMADAGVREQRKVVCQPEQAQQRAARSRWIGVLANLGQHLKHPSVAQVYEPHELRQSDRPVAQHTEARPLLRQG